MREPGAAAAGLPLVADALAARDDAWRQELARVERERDEYRTAYNRVQGELTAERERTPGLTEEAVAAYRERVVAWLNEWGFVRASLAVARDHLDSAPHQLEVARALIQEVRRAR